MSCKNDPFVKLVEKCLQDTGFFFDEDQLLKIASMMELEKPMGEKNGSHFSRLIDIESLTPKQSEVLRIWCQGYTYKQTALKMHRTENTIRSHVRKIYYKLGVKNKTACIERARELGLLSSLC